MDAGAGTSGASQVSEAAQSCVAEKWRLIGSYIEAQGLVKQHIRSFDHFINQRIQGILAANQHVTFTEDQSLYYRFANIRVEKPTHNGRTFPNWEKVSNTPLKLTPQECRMRQLTYCGRILLDGYYPDPSDPSREVVQKDIHIGYMPILVGSDRCHTAGLDPQQRSKVGECVYDRGGYFIVKGMERVTLIQEQGSQNRIVIHHDDKLKGLCATVSSQSSLLRSRAQVFLKNGSLFLQHNSFSKPIPVSVLFRALGVESDQEMVQLVGADLASQLLPTVHSGREQTVSVDTVGGATVVTPVTSVFLARVHIANHLTQADRADFDRLASKESVLHSKARLGLRAVRTMLFSHLNDSYSNYQSRGEDLSLKALYVGLVCRRLLLATKDPSLLMDRDHFAHKRLEFAGDLLALLFEDKFKSVITAFQNRVNMILKPRNRVSRGVNLSKALVDCAFSLTSGIESCLMTGNFYLARFRIRKEGVTQVVSRLSFMSAMGHMCRISSSVEKTRKISGPRSLHGSHWGVICPSDTPEGEGCGLVKNLTLLCNVSLTDTTQQSNLVIKACLHSGMRRLGSIPSIDYCQTHLVWLDGVPIGFCEDPSQLCAHLRLLRRRGEIDPCTSVYISDINPRDQRVEISVDSGRLTRPLLIVDPGNRLRLQAWHVQFIRDGLLEFSDLVSKGIVEYLDVSEQNDALIALSEEQLYSDDHQCYQFTHCEIDTMGILGVVAGLIPFPHHNQSPRNTYQCAMGKQAMGIIGTNMDIRTDSLRYDLVYPQRPLVKSRTLDMMQIDQIPAGHNAVICVMSFSGYDIEDAIILNRASLDRGFGRCIVNRINDIVFREYRGAGLVDRMSSLNVAAFADSGRPPIPDARWAGFERALDWDGIALPGAQVSARRGKLVLKAQPLELSSKRDDHHSGATAGSGGSTGNTLSGGGSGIKSDDLSNAAMEGRHTIGEEIGYEQANLRWVHNNDARIQQVLCTNTSQQDVKMLFRVQTREHRRPEIGDKFSSRHGQKGVCGLIVPAEDMPFAERTGVSPDLIMNPHGFPSRMTVGKMIELVTGKAGVCDGMIRDGSAFAGDPVRETCEVLRKHGFAPSGKDLVTSGLSGESMQCYVYMGPVYYQKLKHMVADKIHARSRGAVTTLCRQPTEGRSRGGGLRLGEMERDCLIAHGASRLLYERLLLSSDLFHTFVCARCGLIQHRGGCKHCGTDEHLSSVRMPYACKLLMQELMSMNIRPKLTLTNV